MQLRDYQQAAVQAVYDHLQRRNDNPVVVCPTGAGKSLLIAKIASDAVKLWQGRVLVLAHVKELLEQNADKIRKLCPDLPVGVYSAGLKRRDTDTPVLVAGIQSIYKRACELEPFDLILVDEAHMIGNGDGMYRQFLSESKVINPLVRVIGLTATPFRLDSGLICTPDHFLNHICYEIGVRELIRDGYLCPLISKAGVHRADYSSVHVRGGEFVVDEVESLANEPNLVAAACQEIVQYTQDRRAVLIFATSVAHGRQVVRTFQEQHGIDCGFVSGLTPADERAALLARFRGDRTSLFSAEPLKYLCNVNVLTTGFDAPRTDCIVMLRPTMSPGLLVQCVGRGFRLHPDKQNCLILDFGGNIERHGPIDQVQPKERKSTDSFTAPAKACPDCHTLVATGFAICPECGYVFPPPDRRKHDAQASNQGVLSGEVTDAEYAVRDPGDNVVPVRSRRSATCHPGCWRSPNGGETSNLVIATWSSNTPRRSLYRKTRPHCRC